MFIYYHFLDVTLLETFVVVDIFIHHRTSSEEKSSLNLSRVLLKGLKFDQNLTCLFLRYRNMIRCNNI